MSTPPAVMLTKETTVLSEAHSRSRSGSPVPPDLVVGSIPCGRPMSHVIIDTPKTAENHPVDNSLVKNPRHCWKKPITELRNYRIIDISQTPMSISRAYPELSPSQAP
jgi:hypothetical protein